MSMNTLNSLLDKAVSVANAAGKKTEEMVEASKLKLQEVGVNSDLQDCYEKIGSLIYQSKKTGADHDSEIEELVSRADDLLAELSQLQSKREEIRKVKKCPNCGASCAVDSHFCSRCGMVLTQEIVPAEEGIKAEVILHPYEPQQAEPSAEEPKQDAGEEPLIEETL